MATILLTASPIGESLRSSTTLIFNLTSKLHKVKPLFTTSLTFVACISCQEITNILNYFMSVDTLVHLHLYKPCHCVLYTPVPSCVTAATSTLIIITVSMLYAYYDKNVVYSHLYVVPPTSLLYAPVPSCVTAATLTLYLVPNCRLVIVVEVELPDTVRAVE